MHPSDAPRLDCSPSVRTVPAVTDPAHLAEARDLARNGQGRQARERSGVSLEELATAVGVSVVDVMAWELGEREPYGEAAVDYVRVVRGLTRQSRPDGA